ncbi:MULTISPECIES: 2-keto-4-pentenoate hydratase [unclassified Streptomyces]|uniref:2-keto-4-pentenoate hydratase n=1 Tax=unclassified Streptomyces TaxID=2593676 RepID=UPI00136BD2D0|nr:MULTISPECIES: 4-oxalocrotonate decarboxylase [unclassified Streptomyces]MCW5251295.1 4-oxalocrotonate decarboxylase [Streptomyces sp. SHP 1-2]MYU22651.1 4-oxalocrotonate decarboxylase [Streptomyces sp. SID8352]
MSDWTIDRAVDELLGREADRRAGDRLSDDWEGLDLPTAYRVQDALVRRKVESGERVVGVKLGLTSRAKQQRMGIDSPLTAWLTDAMMLPEGAPVPLHELIHPRVEPEIAFLMGERLCGPGVTATSALAAVRSVHAGFEVIDSRFADFAFALPDVVADNASSARFVVGGPGLPPRDLDLAREACDLGSDGRVIDSATGAAVQGHPAEALALAANSLGARGIAIEEGWLVLSGGLTDAVPLVPEQEISAEFAHLGTLRLTGV